jgi:hypothetical protein
MRSDSKQRYPSHGPAYADAGFATGLPPVFDAANTADAATWVLRAPPPRLHVKHWLTTETAPSFV